MGETRVNGVRLDYVRKCRCGRRPNIRTGYEGFDDGTGPFIITCECGQSKDPKDHPYGIILPRVMSRSWSKTRVVRNWNEIQRRPSPKDEGNE